MNSYKPFLIQKLKDNSPVRDSLDWHIYIKSMPFIVDGETKDAVKRSWLDEHGDDVFVPDEQMLKAYEIECEFVFKGIYESANTQIASFCQYLRNGGLFSIYDSYTKQGRTNIRYVSRSYDAFYRREGSDDIVIFKVTLEINDPVTNITLAPTT